jgi:hypothetical protein
MAASGRSGDTTFGKNGVNSFRLSKLRSLGQPDPDVQNRIYRETPETMRACIEQGICPFCGAQYNNMAKHTTNTHGVNKDELKDLAGIPRSQGACSAEFSQKLADSVRNRADYQHQLQKMHASPPRKGHKKSISPAGMAVQIAKLEAGRDPERAGKTNTARRLAAVQDRDAVIVSRIQSGELLEDVAADLGIHTKTAKHALKRRGIDVDLRKQAAQSAQRKQKASVALNLGWQRKCANDTAERLRRWAELGKAWDSIQVLAQEWAVSEKQVVGFLRGKGEVVPDGRVASPKRGRRPGPFRSCEISGCSQRHLAKGMCKAHYYEERNRIIGEKSRPTGV